MSTERGNGSRTRAQKYKNRTVFKNDLHDKTVQQKRLNNLHVCEVCHHCKGVIEWKIKYKKYKPLSKPRTCARCLQRKVVKAYHVQCKDCARETRTCAKCLESADKVEIEAPGPTPEEEQKLKAEMDRLIKSFPERKRRAFLRYMVKGKKEEKNASADFFKADEADKNLDEDGDNAAKHIRNRTPHTRDELLKKIQQLKYASDVSNSDFYDEDSDDCTESDDENE